MTTEETVYVAFQGTQCLGEGSLKKVATLCFESKWEDPRSRIAVYEDESGRVIDVDLSGSEEEVLQRLDPGQEAPAPAVRKRGRPKLGVTSKEVSLMPRHWSWLSDQRGGASATLRRLVEAARKNESSESIQRRIIEAAHRFLWDLAGDQPNFEELTRALFAAKLDTVTTLSASWPEGIRVQLGKYLGRYRDAAKTDT